MRKNKIFLFLGPPGSGKGTLASMCVKRLGWLQLSTGDLCREHIQLGTSLGKSIKASTEQGLLVSDEVMVGMVTDWILGQKNEIIKPIIFDGYPRTKKQAEVLYAFLQDALKNFELILVKLNIDKSLLGDRILNRAVCQNKSCGRVYSLFAGSESKSIKSMTCDSCGEVLIKRSDDTLEALHQRLQIYYQHEQQIVDFYVGKGMRIVMLNGAQQPENVFKDFQQVAF